LEEQIVVGFIRFKTLTPPRQVPGKPTSPLAKGGQGEGLEKIMIKIKIKIKKRKYHLKQKYHEDILSVILYKKCFS